VETGIFYAVKSPLTTGTKEDDIRVEKLRLEATILKQLKHKNIIRYYDSFEYNNIFFLILEYIPGLTLSIVRSRKQPTEKQLQSWCNGIALCLDHLHQKGIVYRDLKPGNIIIGPNDIAILIDFGSGQFLSQDSKPRTTASVITPIYAAPEMMYNNISDVRSDIYSFGSVLYFMVTGKEPPCPKVNETLPPSILDEVENVNIRNGIQKACNWKPEIRPQTVKEMWDLLYPNVPMDQPAKDAAPIPPSVDEALSTEVKEIKYSPRLVFVTVAGVPASAEMDLSYGTTFLGRSFVSNEGQSKDKYIPINDKFVSLRSDNKSLPAGHAKMQIEPSSGSTLPKCILEDLESTNGTFVNGKRITNPVDVREGDRISLGPFTIMEFHLK
jgi:serine/threonine protein kinase